MQTETITGGNEHGGAGLRIDNSANVLLSGCAIVDNGFVVGTGSTRTGADNDGALRLQRGRYETVGLVVDMGAYKQTYRPRGTIFFMR